MSLPIAYSTKTKWIWLPFSIKYAKLSPLRVSKGYLCLQQRGINSWQVLLAWMPPLHMFLFFWCFLWETWKLNCWRVLQQVQKQHVTKLVGSRYRALCNGSNILSVLWRCLKTILLRTLDGHYSHSRNKEVTDCARLNGVHIFLPPQSTHKLQPLDISFLQLLKTYYAQ